MKILPSKLIDALVDLYLDNLGQFMKTVLQYVPHFVEILSLKTATYKNYSSSNCMHVVIDITIIFIMLFRK